MIALSDILESRLLQAVVAGLFLAFGWLVNGHQNRRADRRRFAIEREMAEARRAERVRDVHRAIFAEIASYLENLGSEEALLAYRDEIVARMRADPDFVPLVPTEQNDTIFRSILPEIHILPRTSIDPIVSYYNQLFAIEALIADMRGRRFLTLEPERRAAMYTDYIALKTQAFADGHYALRMIGAYGEGGRASALAEEARIARELGEPVSSRVADPFDRSPG